MALGRTRAWIAEIRGADQRLEHNHEPGFGIGVAIVIGLFILFPIAQAVTSAGDAGHHLLTIACALVFVAGYVTMILLPTWIFASVSERVRLLQRCAIGTMFATALALVIVEGASWAYLFSYCAATATLLYSRRLAYAAVGLAVLLAAATPALQGESGGTVLGNASGAAGVALIMLLLRNIAERNGELTRARSELARLAVAEERERFARDLHDLLGHSLSVIALKADLAKRLLDVEPARAEHEVADIESVARQALSEVREAVGGYRQPTLDGEIEGARVALIAAGVDCEIDWDGDGFEPEVESVLAWAVREGATNVIRHSAGHHCVVRILTSGDTRGVEVVDDGDGIGSGSVDGHGLAGLRERVGSLRGEMTAGPLAGGGFRLAVTLPRALQDGRP